MVYFKSVSDLDPGGLMTSQLESELEPAGNPGMPADPLGRSSANLPNAITLARLVLALVIFVLIEWGNVWVLCTVTFLIAVGTDYFDGYFARKWDQVTVLGRIMDPFVDKIVIGGTLIFLTPYPASGITPWITFIVIGREMFITGLRSVLEGHGVDFSAKWSGKLKMAVQSAAIPFALLSMHENIRQWGGEYVTFLQVRDVLLWAMVLITLYSGIEYTWRGWRLMKSQATVPPADSHQTG
jgi:CDP-diacylglycerol---glycerol-3-phosphate 3-phosphatidyltransferase